jgi:hypothetical protein
MSKHGGKRIGAGRKPKDQEQSLIEALDRIVDGDKAIEVLKQLIGEGDIRALQLYLNYRYGKPKESVDVTQFVEQPLFEDVPEDYSSSEDTEAKQED